MPKLEWMKDQDNIPNNFSELVKSIKSYLFLRLDYLKVQLIEKQIGIVSGIAMLLFFGMIVFFALLFFSLAFVEWFGEYTGMMALGFAIAGGIWIFLGLFVYLLRGPLLIDPLIKMWYKSMDLTDNEIDEQQ